MSSAKKLELFPEEQFIQDALRDGTCRLVAEYSMRALGTPDVRLQGRVVHLDTGHLKRLDYALQVNGDLHPIVVFEDRAAGKVYLPDCGHARVTDGFHRHDVYRRAGRETIPAYVFVGPFAAAAKFAAMCNQVNSLARTNEDVEKVVWMLLDVDECRGWSARRIGLHVGASHATVARYRAAYFAARSIEPPARVECEDGRMRPFVRTAGRVRSYVDSGNRSGQGFRVSFDGKKHYLGSDPGEAELRASELLATRELARAQRWPLGHRNGHAARFSRWGVSLRGAGLKNTKQPGLWAFTGHGCVVVWTDLATPESLPLHVGIVLLARQHVDSNHRAVVVCYHEDAAPAVLDLGRQLGVEFLTPDEFIASVGGTAEDSTPPASSPPPDPAAPSAPPP